MNLSTTEILAVVARYNALCEAVEANQQVGGSVFDSALEELDAFLEVYPGIEYYDRNGNWCGPVANENGWLA